MLDLEPIKKREQAAMMPPWRSANDGAGIKDGLGGWVLLSNTSQFRYMPTTDDMAFITHARQDIPALIAEVERLQRMAGNVDLVVENFNTQAVHDRDEMKRENRKLQTEVKRLQETLDTAFECYGRHAQITNPMEGLLSRLIEIADSDDHEKAMLDLVTLADDAREVLQA